MGTVQRLLDRGTRRGELSLKTVANELRAVRLASGLSQHDVADAARISRPAYSRVERSVDSQLTLMTAARLSAVLGLELSVRAFPSGAAIRDAGHAKLMATLLASVAAPLRHATDVPLPATTDHPERRAWDTVRWGNDERTAIEFGTRLYDVQAQTRRIHLKQRDDPPDHLLLVVADTRANRRVIADFADLFADLPRLRTANILRTLRTGHHPPIGLILL